MIGHKLQHCTSKSALNTAVFHSNNFFEFAKNMVKHLLIQWLHKAHIVMCCLNTIFLQWFTCLHGIVAHVADGENGNIFAFFNNPSGTHLDFFHFIFPIRKHTLPSRIANWKCPAWARQLGSEHEVSQFVLVHRCCHYHVRDAPEVSHVISTMMCRTVSTCKTSPVQTKINRKILYTYIMNHLVVSTLHKGAINITKRN